MGASGQLYALTAFTTVERTCVHCTWRWVGSRLVRWIKEFPATTGNRSSNLPARSESLYWLPFIGTYDTLQCTLQWGKLSYFELRNVKLLTFQTKKGICVKCYLIVRIGAVPKNEMPTALCTDAQWQYGQEFVSADCSRLLSVKWRLDSLGLTASNHA